MEKINYEQIFDNIRQSSNPSTLKITDIKICKVDLPPWGSHLIKIETNQGVTGFGEMRDGASSTYMKILKSRLVGENPCDVDRIFRKIKQFGGNARASAGVCATEIALWDLCGKVYGVPVYQLIGGRFRDKVRLYADTHIEDGRATGKLMPAKEVGKILKGYHIMMKKGNFSGPLDFINELKEAEKETRIASLSNNMAEISRANAKLYDFNKIPHPFTNMHVTEKGLDEIEQYIKEVRDVIGYEVPLAIDHFGHFPLVDMIKIAIRLEKFNLAWLEDMLPWYLTDQYKVLKNSTTTPIATGEDIFSLENFESILESGGIDIIHPDLLTSGGILETKKIADHAQKFGVSMAVHMCESPIASLACAHMATATENFFALEYDAFDSIWWEDIIIGPVKPIMKNGFTTVSNAPGLGIVDLNEDVIREHGPIKDKNIWISTDDYNNETSLDRVWS